MVNIFFAVLFFFYTGIAFAKQEPRSIAAEDHIKVINYNPQAIHKYTGFYGYQSSILFEQGEAIQSITMGYTKGWQIVHQGNRLFIKPVEDMADTNATIITNRRVYYFELHAEEATGLDDPRLAYEVRFLYPLLGDGLYEGLYFFGNGNLFENAGHTDIPNLNDIEVAKRGINFNYTLLDVKGSLPIAPIKAFDDGKFTYLQFNKFNSDFPAVFLVDSRGHESLVNFRVVDDYLIIERVSSIFILRHGSNVVYLFNENMPFKKKK